MTLDEFKREARCPRCDRPFEVIMFHGRYETSCCGLELDLEEDDGD